MSMQLGDMLYALDKKAEAASRYQEAAAGKDELIKKLAQQRLRQESIKKSMAETKAVLNN